MVKKSGLETDLSFTPNLRQVDQGFEDLLNTLSVEDLDIDTFIDFDGQVDTSETNIDPSEVDWREKSQFQSLAEVISENFSFESMLQHVVESNSSDDEANSA